MPTDVTAIEGWNLVGAPVAVALGGLAGEDAAAMAGANAVLRRFSALGRLTAGEAAFLDHLDGRGFAARTDIVAEGEAYARASILKDGWAFRYKLLADGRRQILNLLVPGDVVGPYSFIADHSVAALTDAVAVQFSPRGIDERLADYPHIAATIAWSIAREYEMLAERAVCLGRRTAYERVAYLIAEVLVRLQAVGLADDCSFEFPATQEILADALGLSVVHVNRTLRRLRQDGVLGFHCRRVEIADLDGLAEAAALDGGLPDVMPRRRLSG